LDILQNTLVVNEAFVCCLHVKQCHLLDTYYCVILLLMI